MTNRKLAKMIFDFLPFWELPYLGNTENYKAILKDVKENPKEIYDYLYSEYECGKVYNLIINELKRRIK